MWVNVHGSMGPDVETFATGGVWSTSALGDITSETQGYAYQPDGDGDQTQIDWPTPEPPEQNVNVFVDQWSVQANQWPIGENVSLTIQHRNAADDGWDDAYYDETFPSVDAPWDPGMGQFVAQFDIGEAIVAGDLVTASGDVSGSPVVKEHVVTGLAFTGVNVDTNTVSGTAEPGAALQVWVHETGAGVGRRRTVQGIGRRTSPVCLIWCRGPMARRPSPMTMVTRRRSSGRHLRRSRR